MMAEEEESTPQAHSQAPDSDVNNDNDSDSNSGSQSSDDGEEDRQIEWLATARAKRSTAGNRMKSMLANEEAVADDSDLELLFAEDDEDAGFTDAEKDDGSDAQMDSSSDDEGENEAADDLEGEKELERQARMKKTADRKRKAQEAIPMKFRKKARIQDPAAVETGSSTPTGPAPRPKKKSERTSWLPTAADKPTRASERATTKLSKEQLHQQMIERESKRQKQLEMLEKKAKKLEAMKKPPMTQAERLAEAALVEKRNSKSLNRWEEAEKQREEERLAKLAALRNRKLDGPVVTFWSGIQELEEGQMNHIGKMVSMEDKPRKKRVSTAAALATHEQEISGPSTPRPTTPNPAAKPQSEEPQSLLSTPPKVAAGPNPLPTTSVPPAPPVPQPSAEMSSGQSMPSTATPASQTSSLSSRPAMAPPPVPPPVPPPLDAKPPSSVLAAPVLAPPVGATPNALGAAPPVLGFSRMPSGMSNILAHPSTSHSRSASSPAGTASNLAPPAPPPPPSPANPHPTQAPAPAKAPDISKEPTPAPAHGGKVTRSCIILQNFNEEAIKDRQVQNQILFGRKMSKLPKPAHQPPCAVTHHAAKYRDPKTGLPFVNSYAFKEIQRLHAGDYKWSSLLGTWVGTGTIAAAGVPARFLNPRKKDTTGEDPGSKAEDLAKT